MANIATDVQWGSGPKIYFNFSYDKQRSGTTQQYKITVECEPLTGSSYFGYPIYIEISLDGTVAATTTLKAVDPWQWSSAIKYTTGWLNVTNKTTGTTTLKIRVYSGSGNTRNTSYNYNLAVDAAASKIAATDADIESVSTITFTRYNNSFTHTLLYTADGQSGYITIFEKQNITSYGWTVPKALYDFIPDDPRINVGLWCKTYNGNTLVGEEFCTMTATAARAKCDPTLTITAEDTNENTMALTGDKMHVIRFHSDVKVIATPTAKNSASIEKTTLKCGAKTALGTEYTFTDAESIDVSATTTDTRKYSTTKNATGLSLIEYIKLTANTTAKRTEPTADTVEISTKGNYFNGSFGAVDNTLRLQVRYKPQNQAEFEEANTWVEMAVTISGDTYTATATLAGLDYKTTYDICVMATDAIYKEDGPLADAVYNNIPLSKGIPVFDWGEDDFNFNVPVTITGSPLNDFVTEQGADGIWIYRKWASGIAECWGVSNAITQTTSTDWNVMTSNSPTPAIDYPFTFKNPPVVSPSVHIHDGNFWLVTYGAGSTSHTPTYQIARGKSATTITFKLGYYVFGQWK